MSITMRMTGLFLFVLATLAVQTTNARQLVGQQSEWLPSTFDLLIDDYAQVDAAGNHNSHTIEIRVDGRVVDWTVEQAGCRGRACAWAMSAPRVTELKFGRLTAKQMQSIEVALARSRHLNLLRQKRHKPCLPLWTEGYSHAPNLTVFKGERMESWGGSFCHMGGDSYALLPSASTLDAAVRHAAAAVVHRVGPVAATSANHGFQAFTMLSDQSGGGLKPASIALQITSDGWVIETVGYGVRGHDFKAGTLSEANLMIIGLASRVMFALHDAMVPVTSCVPPPDAGSAHISMIRAIHKTDWWRSDCATHNAWDFLDAVIRNISSTALKPLR